MALDIGEGNIGPFVVFWVKVMHVYSLLRSCSLRKNVFKTHIPDPVWFMERAATLSTCHSLFHYRSRPVSRSTLSIANISHFSSKGYRQEQNCAAIHNLTSKRLQTIFPFFTLSSILSLRLIRHTSWPICPAHYLVRNDPTTLLMPPTDIYQRHYTDAQALAARVRSYRVTLAELVFALLFVVNFAAGKLLHMFSQKEEVYNYYNNKGNVFNQFFVKQGWAWTTLVIVLFYALQKPAVRPKPLIWALARYAVATVWWILFTQWCFGLPIMDKVFVATGGKCARIPADRVIAGADPAIFSQLASGAYESAKISSYNCRRLRGTWEGGHDPLGHVFLLVHASLYLFHEIKPFWMGWTEFARAVQTSVRQDGLGRLTRSLPHVPVILLMALWWFMLLVTNMYFHSLGEKLVGLFFGYVGVFAVYYAGRWVRAQR